MKTPTPWLHNGRLLVVAIAAVIVGALGWDVTWPAPPAPAVAAEVTIVPQRGIPDYEREAFGPAWADVDRNGCDTRNDILSRDLEGETFKPGTHDCVVLTGTLHDPYTGETIEFVRGPRSGEVQIDHLVPLAYAWRAGAWEWDEERRRQFANDPANLLAVDGDANQEKSDSGPSEWQPAAMGQCEYASRFDAVLEIYELVPHWLDERWLAETLVGCER